MDVLFAEAGVRYDIIMRLEDANDDLASTDVVLVINANDVVNTHFYCDICNMVCGDAHAVLVTMIEGVRGLCSVAA